MSSDLRFPEPDDEAQDVLQDVLAFLDACEDMGSPVSVQASPSINGDRGPTKRRRAKDYSPDYERRRREKKKAEREALKTQAQQLETQLELLRLKKPVRQAVNTESKWGWVQAATTEEDRRRKAEELNRQLRGLLAQHLNAAQAFKNMLTQEPGLAERVQLVMGSFPPCAAPTPLTTLSSLGAISAHLKGMTGQLYAASDFVFNSASMFKEDTSSLGSFATGASLKNQDPLAGQCIELLSSTPLSCNCTTAVQLLWNMMVGKEVFGPDAACYTMKMKQVTQSSAEMGYSLDFNAPDECGSLDGVTLMRKYEEENRAVLIWTSMMVHEGNPHFRSQGWVSITRPSSNPGGEALVRMCSRVSGAHFGVPCNGTDIDLPVARRHQLLAKSRLERVQMKILDRAEE